jgi:hypothetical protein
LAFTGEKGAVISETGGWQNEIAIK